MNSSDEKPRKRGRPKKQKGFTELAELFTAEFLIINQKINQLMADFTALNQAVADNGTKVDTAIALIQTLKSQGADQATIDTATAALTATNAKIDAATA